MQLTNISLVGSQWRDALLITTELQYSMVLPPFRKSTSVCTTVCLWWNESYYHSQRYEGHFGMLGNRCTYLFAFNKIAPLSIILLAFASVVGRPDRKKGNFDVIIAHFFSLTLPSSSPFLSFFMRFFFLFLVPLNFLHSSLFMNTHSSPIKDFSLNMTIFMLTQVTFSRSTEGSLVSVKCPTKIFYNYHHKEFQSIFMLHTKSLIPP
jgi:hypothetical protein